MTCPRCGAAVAEGKRFCKQCGTALPAPTAGLEAGIPSKTSVVARCSACGAEITPGKKFCGECGTAVPGAQPEAARPVAQQPLVPVETRASPSVPVGSRWTLRVRPLFKLNPYAPELFSIGSTGSGQGAISIAETGEIAAPTGSIPGRPARPATRGEYISIFCAGLGLVTSPPPSGSATSGSPLSQTISNPTVTIGGVRATVSFSGLAPGFVGLYQINAQVPHAAPEGGAVAVVLGIGGATSNTVTTAVQ
jgi:uncharacterized protein (TIGR03437 family)